jgi:hypothetical protein
MSERDPLLKEAIDIINKAGKKSVSLLQRKLRIGYSRAAYLLDEVEKRNGANEEEPEGCKWEEGMMIDGLPYWWRKTCTGDGDTSLWVVAWDGAVPERCPDCGKNVIKDSGRIANPTGAIKEKETNDD